VPLARVLYQDHVLRWLHMNVQRFDFTSRISEDKLHQILFMYHCKCLKRVRGEHEITAISVLISSCFRIFFIAITSLYLAINRLGHWHFQFFILKRYFVQLPLAQPRPTKVGLRTFQSFIRCFVRLLSALFDRASSIRQFKVCSRVSRLRSFEHDFIGCLEPF
jgi:hypothetical protein